MTTQPPYVPDPRLAAESGAGPSRLSNRLRAILAVVLIADVLDLMDSTITNIAAPRSCTTSAEASR